MFEQYRPPSAQKLIASYITDEYVPYQTVMYGLQDDCDYIEPATDFIVSRHLGTPCEKDGEYAPHEKITREGVERYLEDVRGYERKAPPAGQAAQIELIDDQMTCLEREAKYLINYFSRSIKREKIEALTELKRKVLEDRLSVKQAVKDIREQFPSVCSGFFSQRTKHLLISLERPQVLRR